ncbi:PREDICTED: zinc finger protein 28-like isoform X1 [Acropora digitifera]|uniref:zinc finger protein 28-like isoform X1 n=1 Tax=Acropora digitifera TaxID=70779 RepID=UPI00077A2E93|nr:PREDICTED: zinc finger protein 28-like isoform X1 [Acropora digitifera]
MQKPLIMSFKDNSGSEKFSKQTQGEQKRGSSIQSPVGRERAWEYLLRRKAEGITGRIHKVNERSMNHPAESYIPLCSIGVEETERSREPYQRDVSGFTIEACVSSSSAHCSGLAVVPNEGFWLDRTGSRQDQRNSLSSHSVYGKHTSKGTHNYQRKDFIMASLEVKSMQINAEGLHSNVNHAKHTSAEQQTEEALNFTCYYHGQNQLKNSFQQLPCHQDLIPRVSSNMINSGSTPMEDSNQYDENPQDSSMKRTQGCFFNGGPTPIIDSYNENPQDVSVKTNQECFSGSHPSGPPLAHETLKPAKDVSFEPSKQIPVMSSCSRYLILTHLLPYPAEGVEVVYTTDPIEVEAWLRNNVIDCSAQAVGFDIEWKPQLKRKKDGGIENKTAVLQLATESSCLVFQLYNLGRPPNDLVSVLKDERILKVGSGILQDVTKLKKDTGLKCIGLVDTQNLAKEVGMLESQKLGLKALAKYLLGIELEKPKLVTRSNWENFPLTVKQIHYAALDAWIGLKIYRSMKAMQGKSTCKSLEGSNLLNCEEATLNENSNLVNCEEATMNENSTLVNCEEAKMNENSHLVNCEEATMNENPLACHVCGKKFKTSSTLSEHLKVHPKCQCGQYFVNKITKKHMKNCPSLNSFCCHICGEKNETSSALSEHLNVHPKCGCGQYFVDKVSKKHRKNCPLLNPFCCHVCTRKFMTNSELSEHLKVHPKCQCGQYFAGEISTNHWKRCPLLNPCCHVCGKKVKTNSALSEHLKVHPKCQCGQYFVGKISKTHMNECTLLMSPCCHFCGEKSESRSALAEHLKVHSMCLCGQYFVDEISKRHMKECPLLNSRCCRVCGEKVKTNSALSDHLKVHTKCQCGQYFVRKISKEHRMKCSKLNQWAESILKHIKINSDEPGLCNACGKKCTTLESLTRHIRKAGHVLCPFCTDLLPCDASHSHILKCQDLTGK